MTGSTLFIAIGCYVVGLLVGVFATRATYKSKLERAFRDGHGDGLDKAREETAAASEELGEKLEIMRERMLDSLVAYEDALTTFDQRLRPGAKEQLSLGLKEASVAHLDYQPESSDTSKVTEYISSDSEDSEAQTEQISNESGSESGAEVAALSGQVEQVTTDSGAEEKPLEDKLASKDFSTGAPRSAKNSEVFH